MRSGVRVDPGSEEREVHEEVRPVTSVLAGVQVDRSGLRGFGMAAARPILTLGLTSASGGHASVTCRSTACVGKLPLPLSAYSRPRPPSSLPPPTGAIVKSQPQPLPEMKSCLDCR